MMQKTTQKNIPNILIIGCGSIGERHLRCFQSTRRCEVFACDSNEQLLKSVGVRYSARTEPDFHKALRAFRPDAAVICTPAPHHIPMAIAALEAGCHVLIEKPLSTSLKDTGALLNDATRTGRQMAVAYVCRSYPILQKARSFLTGNPFGEIRQIVAHSGQPFHLLRKGYATTYYRDRATGGGAIQDGLTHWANIVEWFAGPTGSVMCDCAHLAVPGVEVEDTVHLSARNAGVLVSYAYNQFQAPNEVSIQFNAMRGSLRVELHNQRWGFCRHDENASAWSDKNWTWEEVPMAGRDTPFIAQANAFLDQIETGSPCLCTIQEAVQTLKFNLAALRSAGTGTRVFCNEITE